MEKTKYYYDVKFNSEVVEESHKKFIDIITNHYKVEIKPTTPQKLSISIKDEKWNFEHIEEFLAMINESESYRLIHVINDYYFISCYDSIVCDVSVKFPDKFNIDTIFNIFENNLSKCSIKKIPKKESFKIFIGHGRDKQWIELKNHLKEKHNFDIACYEIVSKLGTTTKDTLTTLINSCNFALLLLTGENVDEKGSLHARENVIHELGLFQGKLGFKKAIILLEEGVKEFSNIFGLNELRFPKGNIKEIFGDISSTLYKELKIKKSKMSP